MIQKADSETLERDRLAIARGMEQAVALIQKSGHDGINVPVRCVDVFDCIDQAGAKLIFAPLDILGAFFKLDGSAGIILSTMTSLGIQRFVAAHGLGHLVLGHATHLDYERILLRGPLADGRVSRYVTTEEREADAFASYYLLPSSLMEAHMDVQGWEPSDLTQPETVYQASLRFGIGYRGAVHGLERENMINAKTRRELLYAKPESLKRALLHEVELPDLRRNDVWLLTDKDEGAVIEAGRGDVFVLKLAEHFGSGYVWSFNELNEAGFAILKDGGESHEEHRVGGPRIRKVLAQAISPTIKTGTLTLAERRQWKPEDNPQYFKLHYNINTSCKPGLFGRRRGQLPAL